MGQIIFTAVGLAWSKKNYSLKRISTQRATIFTIVYLARPTKNLKLSPKVDRKSFTIEKRTVLSTLRRYSHTNLKMRAVF